MNITLTRGERGGDPERRRQEAEHALAFIGLDSYEVLDFPDTTVVLPPGASARLDELGNVVITVDTSGAATPATASPSTVGV